MEMHVKVSKWDHDLAIRISKEVSKKMRLRDGDVVKVCIESPTPGAVPKKRKKWTEAELPEGATPEMCGPELITGRVGKESL